MIAMLIHGVIAPSRRRLNPTASAARGGRFDSKYVDTEQKWTVFRTWSRLARSGCIEAIHTYSTTSTERGSTPSKLSSTSMMQRHAPVRDGHGGLGPSESSRDGAGRGLGQQSLVPPSLVCVPASPSIATVSSFDFWEFKAHNTGQGNRHDKRIALAIRSASNANLKARRTPAQL